MAQFDVFQLPDDTLVVDLQSNLIETGTRVVAPLVPASENLKAITRLEPVFEIGGKYLALHTAEMAAIPKKFLSREPKADLSAHEYEIKNALDMVFSGF